MPTDLKQDISIDIEYIEDEEVSKTPYFWMIQSNGCNCGHGWSATEVEAIKEAYDYFNVYVNRGDSYV